MRRLRSFGLFWWDFIVGDDPLVAAGVIVMLAACALLAHLSVSGWWLPPLFILSVLGWSLKRSLPHH